MKDKQRKQKNTEKDKGSDNMAAFSKPSKIAFQVAPSKSIDFLNRPKTGNFKKIMERHKRHSSNGSPKS